MDDRSQLPQTAELVASAHAGDQLSNQELEGVVAGKGNNGAFRGPNVGAIRTDNVTAVGGRRRGYYSGPNASAYRGPGGRTFVRRN